MRFVYENELSARPPIIRAGVVGMARRLGWGPTLEPIVFRRGHTDTAVEALYGEYMSDINDARKRRQYSDAGGARVRRRI